MKILNKNTKQAKHYLEAYRDAEFFSVTQAYNNPSFYKVRAEQKIIEQMSKNDGWGYRILGYNSSYFTCGYIIQDYENNPCLIVETYANTYCIIL